MHMERHLLALRYDGDESQLKELPVTDLTAFASLPLDELAAEIERMTRNAKRRVDERAQKYAGHKFTPATAGPSRDAAGDFIPLDRAVAGFYSPEAA